MSNISPISLVSGAAVGAALVFFALRWIPSKAPPPKTSNGFAALVGDTKVVYLKELSELLGIKIYGKCEFLNPGGSVKDRVALKLAQEAKQAGCHTVVEATSGSTGISLAMACKQLGLKLKIVMPDDVSSEKKRSIQVLGGDLHLVRPVSYSDPNHMCRIAQKFAASESGCYYANQFENLVNFESHFHGTAVEILKDVPDIDVFVAAAGTGATMSGCAARLKEEKDHIVTILADPQGSALSARVNSGVLYHAFDREGRRQKIYSDTITEGVGLNRLTENFKRGIAYMDHGVSVSDQESVHMAFYLLYTEGLFLGSSSAVNVAAVVKAVKRGIIKPGQTVVTILCDSGSRHVSKFWSIAFLEEKGLLPGYVNKVTGIIDDITRMTSPLEFVRSD